MRFTGCAIAVLLQLPRLSLMMTCRCRRYTPWQMNIGTDSFGIMNWGPKRLVVKGMWGMIHGQIKYERKGGTLTTLSSYP